MKRFHVLSPKPGTFIFVGDSKVGKTILGRKINAANFIYDDVHVYDDDVAKIIAADKVNDTIIITNDYVVACQYYVRISGQKYTDTDVANMYSSQMKAAMDPETREKFKETVNARFGKRNV